jgi:hypothetical protein
MDERNESEMSTAFFYYFLQREKRKDSSRAAPSTEKIGPARKVRLLQRPALINQLSFFFSKLQNASSKYSSK